MSKTHEADILLPMSVNGAVCCNCKTFIQSKHRHDFKTCECGYISVDGGMSYAKRSWKVDVPDNAGHVNVMLQKGETLREALTALRVDLVMHIAAVKAFDKDYAFTQLSAAIDSIDNIISEIDEKV